MKPLYEKIEEADAVLFGSPVYMCSMTSELKMVIDRLFSYLTMDFGTLLPKGKKCALIFTQNQPDSELFQPHFNATAMMLGILGFEKPEILVCTNTIGYKDDDLKQMVGQNLEASHKNKLKHKAEIFQTDLKKAYALGQRWAG